MIAGIVEEDGDGKGKIESRQLVKESAHTFGSNVCVVGHADQLVRDRVQCAENVKALTASRSFDKDTCD